MSGDDWLTDTRTSYDTVAISYADQVRGAIAELRYLRAALTLLADSVRDAGGGRWRMSAAVPDMSPLTCANLVSMPSVSTCLQE